MDEWIRYGKKIAMRILLTSIKLLPVKKNRVMLVNDLSYKFAGNPKFVGEALERLYPGKFEIVVSVRDMDTYAYLKDRGFKIVKFNSPAYFVSALTSKVFLTNSGGFSYLHLRRQPKTYIHARATPTQAIAAIKSPTAA